MGVRTDIRLNYENNKTIYLYSHWDEVETLKEVIKSVLQRRLRWDDDAYLARMIFSAMVKEDIDGETGYGLSLRSSGDNEIVMDLENQTVDGVSYEDFIL